LIDLIFEMLSLRKGRTSSLLTLAPIINIQSRSPLKNTYNFTATRIILKILFLHSLLIFPSALIHPYYYYSPPSIVSTSTVAAAAKATTKTNPKILPTFAFQIINQQQQRRHPKSHIVNVKMTKEDDYGDDDFLADFDIDAVVATAKGRGDRNSGDRISNTNKKMINYSQQQEQPFERGSKFSTGTKTDPFDFNVDWPTPQQKQQQMNKKTIAFVSSSPPTKKRDFNSLPQNYQGRTMTTSTTPYQKKTKPMSNDDSPSSIIHYRNDNSTNQNFDAKTSFSSKISSLLTKTLQTYFGYNSYRRGQQPVIESILNGRDAAVFWCTGSGKSICYQIPPLHTNKVAIIISPLISLMEDQVSKLNGLGLGGTSSISNNTVADDEDEDIAIFLGSGQMDPMAEQRALDGKYALVYCTPEKLTSSGGGGGVFLDQLAMMHQSTKSICMVAVDESHCVSEWGHDFRPPYRSIGTKLRHHPVLKNIPILALTATAVPQVQNDIISSLHMKNPTINSQSFDRHNLILKIQRKPRGGYREALQTFVSELKDAAAAAHQKSTTTGNKHVVCPIKESTIIYCQTQNLVEEVTLWLSSQFQHEGKGKNYHDDNNVNGIIQVESYHGGQSTANRSRAHINFLTGKSLIIVATIAFGMGIDKPDTRRIIHYGPPKTIEEYYQQIGRAGRDGLDAYCTMYCDTTDFESFKTDFYLGGLSEEARTAKIGNINSLRELSMNDELCRRASLLKFFGEIPSFGERCGTCDTCMTRKLHADDLERDFGNCGARLVLYVISILNGKQGIGIIENILKEKTVEAYRYKSGSVVENVPKTVVRMKEEMVGLKRKKRMPVHYYTKDLLPTLVQKGFVSLKSMSTNVAGMRRSVSWSGYELTPKGWSSLLNEDEAIILPVPSSVRELEEKMENDTKRSLSELKASGADIDQIPQKEIEEGDGEVLKSLKTWFGYLDLLRKNGKSDRINELENLKMRIEAWRSDMAVQFRMAPSDVMPEHLLLSVGYTVASLGNRRLEKEALVSVGVRSGGVDKLVSVLESWMKESNERNTSDATDDVAVDKTNKMVLIDGDFQPSKAWEYVSYKPNKKTGLASWESSYQRFINGEHPQAIAMSPTNGRPIQVTTVVGHILDGLCHGRPVNLQRVASSMHPPPTKSEWDQLIASEAATGMNITGDPKTSGACGESFRMGDFLVPILGNSFFAKEYDERTESEKKTYSTWCSVLKWYMILRRVGYIPQFENDTGNSSFNNNTDGNIDTNVDIQDC